MFDTFPTYWGATKIEKQIIETHHCSTRPKLAPQIMTNPRDPQANPSFIGLSPTLCNEVGIERAAQNMSKAPVAQKYIREIVGNNNGDISHRDIT